MQGQERRDEEPAKQSKKTGWGVGEERKLQQEEIYISHGKGSPTSCPKLTLVEGQIWLIFFKSAFVQSGLNKEQLNHQRETDKPDTF